MPQIDFCDSIKNEENLMSQRAKTSEASSFRKDNKLFSDKDAAATVVVAKHLDKCYFEINKKTCKFIFTFSNSRSSFTKTALL